MSFIVSYRTRTTGVSVALRFSTRKGAEAYAKFAAQMGVYASISTTPRAV